MNFSTLKKPCITIISWIFYCILLGVILGSLGSLFIKSLTFVTEFRTANTHIIFILPFVGFLIAYFYNKYGKNSSKGSNLIIEQIDHGDLKYESVPFRMTPLIFISAVFSHLGGASVGKEGAAIQMAGSISDSLCNLFKLDGLKRKVLLLSGISAGFSGVFGTPIAATLFSLEIVTLGNVSYFALIPCFFASFVACTVGKFLGTPYFSLKINYVPNLTILVFFKILIASICFGICSIIFAKFIKAIRTYLLKLFKRPCIVTFVGGILIILLIYLTGTTDYIGLGEGALKKCLTGEVVWYGFLLKLIFTAISLGSGFKGGELAPLFFIGAFLGNTLGQILGMPPEFLACLGFVGILAGATNTPLACFALGLELFKGSAVEYLFIICIFTYLFSGHHGIYTSQKIVKPKFPWSKSMIGTTIGSNVMHINNSSAINTYNNNRNIPN